MTRPSFLNGQSEEGGGKRRGREDFGGRNMASRKSMMGKEEAGFAEKCFDQRGTSGDFKTAGKKDESGEVIR